ncbi:MAG: hypothetical protein AAGA45_04590 [Verrucomicrobiota bacterium]
MKYPFSHIGIPTTEDKAWDGFYEPGKIHYTDFSQDNFLIEWLKFDADSPMPSLMQSTPHVAYQVDNIEDALEGHEILVPTFSPAEGVRVAFIKHNGAPVEFMEVKD